MQISEEPRWIIRGYHPPRICMIIQIYYLSKSMQQKLINESRRGLIPTERHLQK